MRSFFGRNLRIYVQNAEGSFCSFFFRAVRSFFCTEIRKKRSAKAESNVHKKLRKNGVKFLPKRFAKMPFCFALHTAITTNTTTTYYRSKMITIFQTYMHSFFKKHLASFAVRFHTRNFPMARQSKSVVHSFSFPMYRQCESVVNSFTMAMTRKMTQ